MTDTVLFDRLLKLRLPAFREGLCEQQANPKYLELSFEERMALLVDQECTRRYDNRIRHALRTAAFLMQAAPEDLDLSAAPGLDRKQILEQYQGNWIASHLNILVLGPTSSGKTFVASSPRRSAPRQSGWSTPCVTSLPRACFIPWNRPARKPLHRPVALPGADRPAHPR